MRLSHILPLVLLTLIAEPATAFDKPAEKDTKFKNVTILSGGEATTIEKALVEEDRLQVPVDALPKVNQFTLKPEGLCSAGICVPVPKDSGWTRSINGKTYVDVSRVAEHLDQQVAHCKDHKVWSFGSVPQLRSSLLPAAIAPDFALKDRKGKTVRLSDFRGKKVLLLTWASW